MKAYYQEFSVADFAADEAFIRWAKGLAPDEDEAWRSWLENHPEQQSNVAEARRLVLALNFAPLAHQTDTGALWNRIRESIGEEQPASRRPLVYYLRPLAAAAAIALIALFVWQWWPASVRASRGEHLAYVLPDQSRVTLNADSRIRFRERSWKDQRTLELEGEAFFEVEKGIPFIVETPLGTVEVLGTSFNVFSRQKTFLVRCTTGRVRVTTPSDEEGVVLTPGEQSELLVDGRLSKGIPEAGTEVPWLKDVYYFATQPLGAVFAEIERQFDVRVEAAGAIRQRSYTGFFEGGDLAQALYSVCWPMGLEAEVQDGKVIIREKPPE